ncbi:MAG: phasin family protein, partial [Betaproteobacteria bacterium]|nr:phasin family protein [Betaproteobacteria bacterium]
MGVCQSKPRENRPNVSFFTGNILEMAMSARGHDHFCCAAQKILDSRVEARKIWFVATHKARASTKINPTTRRKAMFSTADQFSNATKASIDAQIAAMNDFANKTLHSMAELVELNIATAKASLEHSSAAAQQIL